MTERVSKKPIAGSCFHVLLALADQPRYGLGIAEAAAESTGAETGPEAGTHPRRDRCPAQRMNS